MQHVHDHVSHDNRRERQDEPGLLELVRDALIRAGLVPLRDFATETTDPTVRIAFLAEVPACAWSTLDGFDICSDGPHALRVGYPGKFAAQRAA